MIKDKAIMKKKKRISEGVATDTRFAVYGDGTTIMLIATFKDGKCQGITMYTVNAKRR